MVMTVLAVSLTAQAAEPAKAAPPSKGLLDWFVFRMDPIIWVLIVLSIISTALIIQHAMAVRRIVLMPPHVELQVRQMLEAKQFRELLSFTSADRSLLSVIMNRALREAPNGYAAMEHEMENALQEQVTRINLKPEILSLLGNTGPLIGLLGTVLGIVLAFIDIVKAGGIPAPGDLADSIGTALVATFWGLAVAIPCLVTYSIIKNKVEGMANDALSIGRECLANLRLGTKTKARPSREGVEAEAGAVA